MRNAVLLAVLCAAVPLRAIELQLPFHQVVAGAASIMRVRVIASTARWTSTRDGRAIVTDVDFAVERVYKGPALTGTTLRFSGGSIGGVTMEVEDGYRFEPGQRMVLFVAGDAAASDPLVGGPQGLYHVAVDLRTKVETVRPSFDESVRPLPLRDFEARIGRLVTP